MQYILETNTRISFFIFIWLISLFIFSSYLIFLLFDACMDLDHSLRCPKLEHWAQMSDCSFGKNPIKWNSVTKPLEFILPNWVLKRLFTCTIEVFFLSSTQSKDCHQALTGNEFLGAEGGGFFFFCLHPNKIIFIDNLNVVYRSSVRRIISCAPTQKLSINGNLLLRLCCHRLHRIPLLSVSLSARWPSHFLLSSLAC